MKFKYLTMQMTPQQYVAEYVKTMMLVNKYWRVY